jgi:hypothetical protein
MTTSVAPPEIADPPRPEEEALLREAKRRHRLRRSWQTATVIVLVSGLVLLVLYATNEPPLVHGAPTTGTTRSLPPPIASGPSNLRGELDGVDCPSPTECWAVGGIGGRLAPSLIERWARGRWQIITSPSPVTPMIFGLPHSNTMQTISCASSQACVTIGNHNGEQGYAIAEKWLGHRWVLTESPPELGGSGGVSCPLSNACAAVGTSAAGPQATADLWNGSTWRPLTVPNSNVAIFSGASCTSATSCWFVGQGSNPGPNTSNAFGYAVADRWAGGRWTVDHIAVPTGGSSFVLNAISCVSSRFCLAVGSYEQSAGRNNEAVTLSAIWNGATWKTLRMPSGEPGDSDGSTADASTSVACSSAADCLAAGGPTVEHFNGRHWTLLHTRTSQGLPRIYFDGVSVLRGSRYMVVGSTNLGGEVVGNELVYRGVVVIEEFDGHSFRLLQD